MKQSLSWRFNLSAISLITVILVLFGAYDYTVTSSSLNRKMDTDLGVLAESLQSTLPASLWNFETDQLVRSLESSINNTNIVGIMVLESDNAVAGFIRDLNGQISETTDIALLGDDYLEYPLEFIESGSVNNVGTLIMVKNLAFIDAQQRSAIGAAILQIIVLDILVALSIRFLVGRLVKAPLNDISDALKDIASGDGDLTQRLKIQRRDEIGRVARYFNTFVEKIHLAMQQVDSSAQEMNGTVERVNVNAQTNSDSVSRAHEETDQVATAINEMSATAHEVANNAQQVSESARSADSETKNTQTVVQETSASIEALAGDIKSGADVMSSLQGDVNSIVGVLETIRGIAEQTNLLALNAAIEAARAGDQGRGFAVVADEVRALAARTQESTGEIQSMIEKLERGSGQAVDVMQQSTDRSVETVERVQKAIESLAVIGTSIETINDMSTQIAAAVEEQTHVTEEINKNVSNIVSAIQATAESAKETAEASNNLTDHAHSLGNMVGQFRL